MSTPNLVPFINITRYENGFLEEITAQTAHLLKSGQFTGGPSIAACEENLKNFSESAHCVSCANGTDALQLALRAAGLGRGKKVLVPEMTFWATFEAVVNIGADPLTLDVQRESLHISLSDVEAFYAKQKFDALLLVHLYGWAAPDTLAIRSFCKQRDIILIEDAAQAFGTRLGNESLIGGATIATSSFYPAKVLGASGDAGAVFCKDKAFADRIKKLRDHGRLSHYEYDAIGWNSRMGAYEATFLNLALKYLPGRIEQRLKICDRYSKELQNLDLKVLRATSSCVENGYANVLWTKDSQRDAFQKFLSSEGVDTRVIYPGAMSKQPGATPYLTGKESNTQANLIAHSVLNLPCFAGMTDAEQTQVIDAVKKYYKTR